MFVKEGKLYEKVLDEAFPKVFSYVDSIGSVVIFIALPLGALGAVQVLELARLSIMLLPWIIVCDKTLNTGIG